VLGRLVDLEAEDGGTAGTLKRDDAVGAYDLHARVGGDRLWQPALDEVGLRADERTHGGDDVELMAESTDAAESWVRVSEPVHATATQSIRDRDPTSDRQDRSAFDEAELPQSTEVPERRSATRVDQRHQL